MQIKIDLKIFILGLILLLVNDIKIYIILMIFAMAHEIAHLITGIILGLKPKSISILPYGFKILFDVKVKDLNTKIGKGTILSIKKIIIALAGPIVNIIFIIIFWIFKYKIFGITYDYIVYANMLIAIFNLLPIYPLDGGRILKEIIKINRGIGISYIYINKISNISIIIITILSRHIPKFFVPMNERV
jgi:stage IV sporulation protein FB